MATACTLYFSDPGTSGGPPPTPIGGTADAGPGGWSDDGGSYYPDAAIVFDAGYIIDATAPQYPDAPPCCDPHPDAAVAPDAGGGCTTP